MRPQRILVTGAGGALGPAVVEQMAGEGHSVRALVRTPVSLAAEIVFGDVRDSGAVRRAMSGCEAVVHLAASLHGRHNSESEIRSVNVEGTRVVCEAATAEKAHFVLASTIAVYGPVEDVATEDTIPKPDTLYAVTKLESESIVLSAGGTVLRLAATYGGRVKGNYLRLVRALARRRFVPIGPGENYRTLLYDRDAARAFSAAVARRQRGLYNVTDGELHRVKDIIATICVELGRRPPLISIPIGPVRRAARLAGVSRMIDKYLENVAVSGDRIRTDLDFRAEYDLQRGWAETIEILRRRGEL